MHQVVQLNEGIFSQASVLQYRVKRTFNCSHLQPSVEEIYQQNRQFQFMYQKNFSHSQHILLNGLLVSANSSSHYRTSIPESTKETIKIIYWVELSIIYR